MDTTDNFIKIATEAQSNWPRDNAYSPYEHDNFGQYLGLKLYNESVSVISKGESADYEQAKLLARWALENNNGESE